MAQAAPAPDVERLAERVDRAKNIYIKTGSISQLEFMSLERDIKKVLSVDPANAYDLLGRLYVFKNDIQAVKDAFQNAIKLDKSDAAMRLGNLHVSLMNISRFVHQASLFDDADVVLREAYEFGKSVYSVYSTTLYDKLFDYQHFEKALEVASMVKLATVNNPIPELEEDYLRLNSIVHESGLPIEHCPNLLKMLFQFLSSKNIPFKTTNLAYDERVYHNYGYLQYLIGVKNQTIEELVALQFEFELMKAEYDIEHNVNTYMIMYEITSEEEVLSKKASSNTSIQ